VTIAYETYGTLNADASNAILVERTLSPETPMRRSMRRSEDRLVDRHDRSGKPSIRPVLVICSNILGAAREHGTIIHQARTGRRMGEVPVITIADMVRVQRRLIRSSKIERLLSVAGGHGRHAGPAWVPLS